MSKHSPGPWVVGLSNKFVPVIRAANGRTVAMVDWRPTPHRDHDVALIAAAPDLLAALKAILEFDDLSPLDHDNLQAAFKRARAAITKAGG